MSRIRTIYNNEALLAGPSPATGANTTGNIKRIHRVQSLGTSIEIPLENINEYGKMAAIDRINTDGATVGVEFSYLLADFENEVNLGFVVHQNTGALSNFLNKTQTDRNLFRFVAPEGIDAEGSTAAQGAVLGVGNAFLSNYSAEMAVGSLPTASLSYTALNASSNTSGVSQPIPAVDPATGRKATGTYTLPAIAASSAGKPSILRPGDISIAFTNGDAALFQSLPTLSVQSVSVSADLNLEEIRKLGSRLAIAREITPPVDVQVSIEALMNTLTTGNLVNFICSSPTTDITVNLSNGACDASGPLATTIFAKMIIKNARLTSTNLDGSIGPSDTVSMSFVSQIGAANDSANGLFFSGVTGYSGSTPVYSPV